MTNILKPSSNLTKNSAYLVMSFLFLLTGCSHADTDIKETIKKTIVSTNYSEVQLDWNLNTFTHGEYTINIPNTWGAGIKGRIERFKEMDPHDIEFSYTILEQLTYGGDVVVNSKFNELVEHEPKKVNKIFEINVTSIDLESKLIVKDELVNDYYFNYDFNENLYNTCCFKIAKNDVNQLKDGYFNQINVRLDYLIHYDDAMSFVVSEKDGMNNIGNYSDVSIVHNPSL